MRKSLPVVVIISVIAICLPVLGQEFSDVDTMSIDERDGMPGDTLLIPVDLVNTFDVAGFELRIAYDTSAFDVPGAVLGERASGFDLFGANLTEPGIVGFTATSMNPRENALPPGNGAIVNISFVVREDAPPGEFDLEFVSVDYNTYNNSLSNTDWVLVIPVLDHGLIEVRTQTGIGGEVSLPRVIDLRQNYPNPFNMRTMIPFRLDRPGHVDLEIYDLTGRLVASVYSGRAEAGENAVSWNGCNAAGAQPGSGVFFYRLKTTWGESVTKRMTLLK